MGECSLEDLAEAGKEAVPDGVLLEPKDAVALGKLLTENIMKISRLIKEMKELRAQMAAMQLHLPANTTLNAERPAGKQASARAGKRRVY